MKKILLKLFIKDWENTGSPQVRGRIGKLTGIVGIVANCLLFALKLGAGLISGSVSVVADAMNNLSDSVSSLVTLIGFKLAEKPADRDHPYGHARYEYLSGLAVAAMIVIIGFELAKSAVEKILHPVRVEIGLPMVLVLVGSLAVKLWLSCFQSSLGKQIRSSALVAAAADSRNDVLATAAVLVAAVLEALTSWRLDGYVGLGVALFILYSGAMLAKETISPLLGETASPELRQLILETVAQESWVLGYHDLMVHDYGPGQRFASLHVEMDRRADPLCCHERIDAMERRCLQEHGIHLVIHYDPVTVGDPELDRMRLQVQNLLLEQDERLHLHDFRMVQGEQHTNLIFDVALPDDKKGQEEAIGRQLEAALNRSGDRIYHAVITFDPEAFNAH